MRLFDDADGVLSVLEGSDPESELYLPSQLSNNFALCPKQRSFVPSTWTVGIGKPDGPTREPTVSSSLSVFAAIDGGISAVQKKVANAIGDTSCPFDE